MDMSIFSPLAHSYLSLGYVYEAYYRHIVFLIGQFLTILEAMLPQFLSTPARWTLSHRKYLFF